MNVSAKRAARRPLWPRLALCAALLFALCAAPLSLASADALSLSVRRADGVGEAVRVWERDGGKRYLFLPAYMAGQPLTVDYGRAKRLTLGDVTLADGAVTDALVPGATLTLDEGGRRARVTVLQSTLPAVHLTTRSGSLNYIHRKKGNRETGTVTVVTPDGEVDYAGALDFVKGHGNATFVYEKKSYQIKLSEKGALLHMDAGKRFVLLANQHENSLMRNRLTFALADAIGLTYTPEWRSVDLYANGEYRGNYLLTDKVTIASSSVDLEESEDAVEDANARFLARGGEPERYGEREYAPGTYKGAAWPAEPEDVTGGFLFELEYQTRYEDEESGVVTPRGQPVVVKEPERMTLAQGAYAYELLSRFERAIFSPDGVDPESGQRYTQIADLPSLARKFLIEELSKNYDAARSSQYFYKDSDEVDPLLYAGPVWDYDSAYGNYAHAGRLSTAKPTGMAIDNAQDYAWWPALYAQADFRAEVARVWRETLRPLALGFIGDAPPPEGATLGTLNAWAAELSASAGMNFERWRIFNHETRAVKTGADYPQNIAYLRDWLRERIAYLDGLWGA